MICLIADNDITHVQMAAILLSPEYRWMEIRKLRQYNYQANTISDCGFNPVSSLTDQTGIVSVTSPSATPLYSSGIIHKNIQIVGNRFNNCPGINILVTSVSGVKIAGKSFHNVTPDNASGHTNSELAGHAATFTGNCTKVVIKRNKTE